MNLTIANPIYDTVFKYVLENQEVATALVSHLLGLEILELQPQPQEVTDFYASSPREDGVSIRIFRLDFSAVIRSKDGRQQRVLIELQKASKSEALNRFRSYLSTHYAQPASKESSLPVVAIYMLGFWMNSSLPVVTKVSRRYIDGVSGDELRETAPDRFIEMLTHDAVIVQLPGVSQLTGDSELEQMLRIFDQSQCRTDNPHFLSFSDTALDSAPPWIQKLVRMLQNAAASSELRKHMALEDEASEMMQVIESAKGIKLQLQKTLQEKEALARLNHEVIEQKEMEIREKQQAQARVAELEAELAKLQTR